MKTLPSNIVLFFALLASPAGAVDWEQLKSWEQNSQWTSIQDYLLQPQLQDPQVLVWYLQRVPTYLGAWKVLEAWQGKTLPTEVLGQVYRQLAQLALLASDWSRLSFLVQHIPDTKLLAWIQQLRGEVGHGVPPLRIRLWRLVQAGEWETLQKDLEQNQSDPDVSLIEREYFKILVLRGLRSPLADEAESKFLEKYPDSPEGLLLKGTWEPWLLSPLSGTFPKPEEVQNIYQIQVGAYRQISLAEQLQKRLKDLGWTAELLQDGEFWKVLVLSPEPKRDLDRLKTQGFAGFVTSTP